MQKAVISGVFSFANYLAPTSISSLIMVLLAPKRFFYRFHFTIFLWHQWSKMHLFVIRSHLIFVTLLPFCRPAASRQRKSNILYKHLRDNCNIVRKKAEPQRLCQTIIRYRSRKRITEQIFFAGPLGVFFSNRLFFGCFQGKT